jgi:RimJ/RimL family protein N-acetyltransferase
MAMHKLDQTLQKISDLEKQFPVTVRMAEKSDLNFLVQASMTADYLLYFNRVQLGGVAKQRDEVLQWIALNVLAVSPRQTLMIDDGKGAPMGFAVLADLDWRNRNAALEVYIDPAFRQSQMAVIAATKIFAYAFNQLGLHKVYSYVFGYNQAMLQIHKDMKQEPEVIYRNHSNVDGKWHDVHVFAYFNNYYDRQDYMKKIENIREFSLLQFVNPERHIKQLALLLAQLGYLSATVGNEKPQSQLLKTALLEYQKSKKLNLSSDFDEETVAALLEDVIERNNKS